MPLNDKKALHYHVQMLNPAPKSYLLFSDNEGNQMQKKMNHFLWLISYFSSIHEFFDSLLWLKEKTHEHNIYYSAFIDISMVTSKDFLAGF